MNDKPHESGLRALLAELRRRRVFTVVAIYVSVAWATIEILTFLFERLGWPDWTVDLTAAIFVAGFPVTVILAWMFDIARTPPSSAIGKTTIVVSALLLVGSSWGLFKLFHDVPRVIPKLVAPTEVTMAVLPFRYLSAEGNVPNIAAGFTHDIRSALSKLTGFVVTARSSSQAAGDRMTDPAQIGELLGVGKVLHGNLSEQDNQLKVTATLTDVATGNILWSDSFNRTRADLFDIQNDVASFVVGKSQAALIDEIAWDYEQRGPENADAYYLYLLGRYHFYRQQRENFEQGLELFEQAIALDDNNPLAHAGYAQTCSQLNSSYKATECRPKAAAAARKALELSPDSALVLNAIGDYCDWLTDDICVDAETGDRNPWKKRALAIEPNLADAHEGGCRNHHDFQATRECDWRRYRLDPFNEHAISVAAGNMVTAGETEQAIELLRDKLRLIPDSAMLNTSLGRSQGRTCRLSGAVQAGLRAVELDVGGGWRWQWLAEDYVRLGDTENARYWGDRALETGIFVGHFLRIQQRIAAINGETDTFYDYIRETYPDFKGFVYFWAALHAGDYDAVLRLWDEWKEGYWSSIRWISWEPLSTYSNVYNSRMVNEVAFVFQQLGEPEKADELLERSLERQLRFYGMGIRLPRQLKNHAVTLYLMGRTDEAMEKMQEAIDYGWCDSVFMTNDPVMDLLREDPRYREMEAGVTRHIENERKRLERAGIGARHDQG